jgi:DNA-binding NarL/FixJ family response regulator
METIRVLVVGDIACYMESLARLVSNSPGIYAVTASAMGQPERLVAEGPPDVLLVDGNVIRPEAGPKLLGEATSRLVAFAIAEDSPQHAVSWLRAGAASLIGRSADPTEVVNIVRSSAAGIMSVSACLAAVLRSNMVEPSALDLDPWAAFGLTARERQVAELLVRGASNKAIGKALSIGAGTAKNHVASIYIKLGVCGRTDARERLARARAEPDASLVLI